MKFLRHAVFAVLGVYVVVSLAFAVIALTPDPKEALIAHQLARHGQGDLIGDRIAAYRAARNLDVPVSVRYAKWVVDITVLDWGRSFRTGQPVLTMVGEGLRFTFAYLLPGVVVGSVGGIWAGLTDALDRRGGSTARLASLSYVAFGLPSFWVAAVFLVGVAPAVSWYPQALVRGGPLTGTNPLYLAAPAAVVAANVFAGQLRYARTKGREYANSDLVKQHRATGASPRRVARHVLRLAAVPLLAVSMADVVAILVVNVFVVEKVFSIPGLGTTAYRAVLDRDLPVVLGATMAIALSGIGLNFLQEVANTALDPRLGDEGGDV